MFRQKIDCCFQAVENVGVLLSWSATLFVTFMLVSDVLLRFFFNKPLPASWEISEVAMPYIVMFGFACTLSSDVHVRVTILTDRLPAWIQLGCDLFRNGISFIFCCLLAYWSWLSFWKSFIIGEEILAAIRIPWWIGKFVMPVAFAMLGVRFFFLLIKNINRLKGKPKQEVA